MFVVITPLEKLCE